MAISRAISLRHALSRISPSVHRWPWPLFSHSRNCSSSSSSPPESSLSSSSIFADLNTNANQPPLNTPKLFVSGLSRLTTDEKLRDAFSKFGQLIEAKVITDRQSGRSKGFGFVTYATIEDAEQAREGMNAKFLDGWVIFVDPAKPREPRPPPRPQELASTNDGVRSNKTIGWCG